MIPDGYLPPLRNTEDIPIHRPSVGGMGLSTTTPEFKVYQYRGIGSDLYEMPAPSPWPEPTPKPVPKPPPPTPRQQRAQEMAREIRRERLIEEQNQRVAAQAVREAQRLLALAEQPEPKKRKKPKHKKPKPPAPAPQPPPAPRPAPSRHPRPSPGWQAPTGADIEALLEDLGVD